MCNCDEMPLEDLFGRRPGARGNHPGFQRIPPPPGESFATWTADRILVGPAVVRIRCYRERQDRRWFGWCSFLVDRIDSSSVGTLGQLLVGSSTRRSSPSYRAGSARVVVDVAAQPRFGQRGAAVRGAVRPPLDDDLFATVPAACSPFDLLRSLPPRCRVSVLLYRMFILCSATSAMGYPEARWSKRSGKWPCRAACRRVRAASRGQGDRSRARRSVTVRVRHAAPREPRAAVLRRGSARSRRACGRYTAGRLRVDDTDGQGPRSLSDRVLAR